MSFHPSDRCRLRRAAAVAVAFAAFSAARLEGQVTTCQPLPGESSVASEGWTAPLDHLVTIDARNLPLREVLAHLSSATGIRLSYSAESIEGDRPVCLTIHRVPLGDALRVLLPAKVIGPTIAGPDHVVLTRALDLTPAADREPRVTEVITLEQIIVTGETPALPRAITHAAVVIDADQIAARSESDLPRLLSSTVPGLWAWISSPADFQVRYGSVRGASSFGATYPKVYLDGIQVANPRVLAHLTPEAIERIEVIRGPQGGALYGTDAISGVVNIHTKRRGNLAGSPHIQFRTGAGIGASDFSPGSVLSQEHVITGWLGDAGRSGNFSFGGGSTGEFVPGAGSRYVSFNGSGQSVGSISVVTATARLNFTSARSGVDPLPGSISFEPILPRALPTTSEFLDRSALQYTLGTSLNLSGAEDWTHSLIVGVDGYRISGSGDEVAPSSRRLSGDGQAGGAADRLSVRANSVWQIADSRAATAALTLGGERSILREQDVASGPHHSAADVGSRPIDLVTWQRTTGIFARGNIAFHDLLHLDAGLRLEANDEFGASSGFQKLPMLGAAIVADHRGLTGKLRTAYGRGIRPSRTALREALRSGAVPPHAALDLPPESQTGIEVGADLSYGSRFALAVTRFDQLASGLVQTVILGRQPASGSVSAGTGYFLQNVGEISNTGWEVETSASVGRLAIDATVASVDSRVRRLATGYLGDLRPGDRMLEVPGRTASLTATWFSPRWTASVATSKAWSWVNYDRARLDRAAASTMTQAETPGSWLREYWREYDGTPRLGVSGAFELRPGLSLLLGAENLFDNQFGEPDSITIVPGRTFSLGFRGNF